MKKIVAFVLAGGMGSRLNVLVWRRAKPAVPFGGCYRIIDFTMSNIMHSGIEQVGILTQYQPYSLMSHIRAGEAWDLVGHNRCTKILPPSTGMKGSDWYRGTADAVAQNLDFAKHFNAEDVLVLSGDHIYKMDYTPMISFHREKQADITIAMREVPWEDTNHFGIASVDGEQRIIDWQEKPEQAQNNLASMGIYLFNFKFLEEMLSKSNGSDFGQNVIPEAYNKSRVFGYVFKGYWADVGTLRAFWNSNMEILRADSGLRLKEWKVCTNLDEEDLGWARPPSHIGKDAKIIDSLISSGCTIEGYVERSILSPGVRIEMGAKVIDSIIMHDAVIERDAFLFEVIADEKTHIGVNAQVGIGENTGPNQKYPDHVFTGLTVIGKKATIPAYTKIYRNTIIEPSADEESLKRVKLEVGSYVVT